MGGPICNQNVGGPIRSPFLEFSPPWQRIIWAVMAGTGIRKGEAAQLLISDY